MQIERQPEVQLQQQQSDVNQQVSMLGVLSGDLQALYTAANSLNDVNGGLPESQPRQAAMVSSAQRRVSAPSPETTR